MPEFDPANFGNGPWNNTTTLHPLAALLIVVLGLALLLLPRRWAVAPMIVMACFVAPAQRIVVFTLDFDLLRIMVLFGWLRLVIRREAGGFRWQTMDTVILCWAASATIINTLQHQSIEALINRLGFSFDMLGMYYLFRCLVRDWCDFEHVVLAFVVVSVPVAAVFLIENQTGHNAFAFFGGVPEITMVRNGRPRCQGAFAHPILAGCFWASLAPLFAARWWYGGRQRLVAVVGLATSGVIILCCASSTPVTAVLLGVVAAAFFPLRRHMRWVRWALVGTLVGLHLVMKTPVWHLLARIDIIGGSTGWHRYFLVNLMVQHFGDWWLLGTHNTEGWHPRGFVDVTNQYFLEGLSGGLLTLSIFVALIVLCFQAVGRCWRQAGRDARHAIMAWALGVSLFIHCVNFFAISYFGQIIMLLYLSLAIIAGLAPAVRRTAPVRRSQLASGTRMFPPTAATCVPAALRRNR